MKTEKQGIKIYITGLAIIIIFLSGFNNGLSISSSTISTYYMLKMFEVKGFMIALTGLVILLYSSITKRKGLYIVSILITIVGYTYSAIAILSVLGKQASEIIINTHIGLILYILSAVIALISILIPSKNNPTNETILNTKNEKENSIFTKKILGFKEIPYEALTVLSNDKNSKMLMLSYTINNEVKSITLPYKQIKDINYIVSTRLSEVSPKTNDSFAANALLSAVLFGGNPIIASGALAYLNSDDTSQKTKFTTSFDIKITIIPTNETSEIILTTLVNPERFINEIKNDIIQT